MSNRTYGIKKTEYCTYLIFKSAEKSDLFYFFLIVKEIYKLIMIAMLYPTHITIAVQFDTPVG